MNVPLLDLVGQYRAIKDEVLPALQAVIESQQFIMGPAVSQLEAKVAELSHARYGVGCASGTDALLLPLRALNLRPGDEVITTPFTFVATAEVTVLLRARPVFVDVEPDTCNIDAAKIESAVTGRLVIFSRAWKARSTGPPTRSTSPRAPRKTSPRSTPRWRRIGRRIAARCIREPSRRWTKGLRTPRPSNKS